MLFLKFSASSIATQEIPTQEIPTQPPTTPIPTKPLTTPIPTQPLTTPIPTQPLTTPIDQITEEVKNYNTMEGNFLQCISLYQYINETNKTDLKTIFNDIINNILHITTKYQTEKIDQKNFIEVSKPQTTKEIEEEIKKIGQEFDNFTLQQIKDKLHVLLVSYTNLSHKYKQELITDAEFKKKMNETIDKINNIRKNQAFRTNTPEEDKIINPDSIDDKNKDNNKDKDNNTPISLWKAMTIGTGIAGVFSYFIIEQMLKIEESISY